MFEGKIGKDLMIQQGYVPKTCTLPDEIAGSIIYAEIQAGRSPCDECQENRMVCKGTPRVERRRF